MTYQGPPALLAENLGFRRPGLRVSVPLPGSLHRWLALRFRLEAISGVIF